MPLHETYCLGCRTWFATQDECPSCGWERPRPNRALHVASLNANLYDQAERSTEEMRKWRRSVAEEERTRKRYGLEPATMTPFTAQEKQILRSKPKPAA